MSVIPYPHALSQIFQRLIGHKAEETDFWYCCNCGTKNPRTMKACGECGQNLLVKLSVEPIPAKYRRKEGTQK
jgi:hypothetical protein